MCARTDLIKPGDRTLVAEVRSWTPEEALVEPQSSTVRITPLEVDVPRLKVRRREHRAGQHRRLEVLDMAPEAGNDAVGIALAQRLRPAAVANVDLASGVAADVPWQLLKLDPENSPPVGSARGVERQWLSDRHRRLDGQQAALGFVDRARHAVKPGRDMDIGALAEPWVTDQRGGSDNATWICMLARPART